MSITLDQITKRYQGAPVVNDVSIDIGDGEFFVLLGPSGSGKSTLLRAVAGLTAVDHGRISLHGRDVTHVSARKRGAASYCGWSRLRAWMSACRPSSPEVSSSASPLPERSLTSLRCCSSMSP